METPSKIVCVGRNYVAHAAELGNEVPDEPLIFLKPPSAVIHDGEEIRIPPGVGRVDYEGEIALRVGRRAKSVDVAGAEAFIDGVLPLNDVTARDLQSVDDQWTRAKGFDTFCPVGDPVSARSVDLAGLEVITRVDGEVRQRAHVREMAFSFAEIVAYVSAIMTLEPGDLIATGTPEGIGGLSPGEVVEVEIPGVGVLANPVVQGE